MYNRLQQSPSLLCSTVSAVMTRPVLSGKGGTIDFAIESLIFSPDFTFELKFLQWLLVLGLFS